jgi:hypothetical protein
LRFVRFISYYTDQIIIDDKYIPQLSAAYLSALNDVRDADQQIQLALESSVLNAQQNKVLQKKILFPKFDFYLIRIQEWMQENFDLNEWRFDQT